MTALKKIRTRIGEWSLRKERDKTVRKPQLTNLKHARNIGIITDLPPGYKSGPLLNLCRRFDNEYKDYQVLAYFDSSKQIPPVLPVKDNILCFNHKDLDWKFCPKNEKIASFISGKFDVVIDLSMNHVFPVKYIVTKSRAGVKLSRFIPEDAYADIMIQIDKQPDQDFLIQQIDYYLDMLTNYSK